MTLAVKVALNPIQPTIQQSCCILMGILFTNRKLPPIPTESVPRGRSKASTYSYAVFFFICNEFTFTYIHYM